MLFQKFFPLLILSFLAAVWASAASDDPRSSDPGDANFLEPQTGKWIVMKAPQIAAICDAVLQPPEKKRSGIIIPEEERKRFAFRFSGASGTLVNPQRLPVRNYLTLLGLLGIDFAKFTGRVVVDVESDYSVAAEYLIQNHGVRAHATSMIYIPTFGSKDKKLNYPAVLDRVKELRKKSIESANLYDPPLELGLHQGAVPTHLSFEDGTVDYVLVMNTLNFLEDVGFQQAIWEIYRILKFTRGADILSSLHQHERENRRTRLLKKILTDNAIAFEVFPNFPNAIRIRKNFAFTPKFGTIDTSQLH